MHRRSLLAIVGCGVAGLSGCTSLADSNSTPENATAPANASDPADPTNSGNTSDEDENTTDGRELPADYVGAIELETQPYTVGLGNIHLRTSDNARLSLWFDRTATDDHPARISGYLENGNEFENTFRLERFPILGPRPGQQPLEESNEGSLHTPPTENNEIASAVPDVTQNDAGYWVYEEGDSWMPDLYRLDPGERIQLEFVLTGHPETEGLSTGTYKFRGVEENIDIEVWNTAQPGPDGESRLAGRTVPTPPHVDSIQWYHEADASTGVYVEPSTERIELDGAVEFELINHSEEGFRCGQWDVYKLVDGSWYSVNPPEFSAISYSIRPGSTSGFTLRAFNGEPVPCRSPTWSALTRGFLGGGEYAVVAGCGYPEDAAGALVELDGDPVEFTLGEHASVEYEGDTAIITNDLNIIGDEHDPKAAYSLTRVDTAEERLIPERIANGSGSGLERFLPPEKALRNPLAVMDSDIDRVIVRADEYNVNKVLGDGNDTYRFEVRGQAYEATRLSEVE